MEIESLFYSNLPLEIIDKIYKDLCVLKRVSNNIKAQLLYSKILFSGDLTPQDFKKSYFWGFSALLGGLNKSSVILEKLDEYLTEKQIEKIRNNLREFLEKRAPKWKNK